MGQYYKPVCLDRQECLDAHDYGNGLKLMEHSWLHNNFVGAVMDLLKPQGAWYKTKIVWAGDYMDEGLFLDQIKGVRSCDNTLYACSWPIEEQAPPPLRVINPVRQDGPTADYLVNHSQAQYVYLKSLPEEEPGWTIHPLPLLTCSGNGRGGGDFRGKSRLVGKWAGDVISAEYIRPLNYRKLEPKFTERRMAA